MAPGAIFHVLRLAFVSLLRQRTADCSHQKGCGAQRPHRYLSPNRAHVRGISGAKICNCRQICSQSLIQIKKPASAMRLMVFMNTKKQQQVDPSASPYLVEAIEVADRKIKDYLLRQHLSLWHPISTAPNNHDLELKVLNGASPVVLPFPCRQTNVSEWINADLETANDIQPTNWRPWQKAKVREPRLGAGSSLSHQNKRRWSDT